ncbi:PEGA domain-containing protein [Chloracidobacterium thermophilum]|uniref:PEGA domain-containing protein n=1 Tax=Chloracidobacterium thermophilum TaxID=458033 RepID=UPI000738B7FF|nr:PEGA domain-containing protein [Chloracidobacterium thermophilum]
MAKYQRHESPNIEHPMKAQPKAPILTPLPPRPLPPPKAPLPSRRAVTQWLYGLGGILVLLIAGAALLYFSKPTVIILTNATGATVYLDGEPRGTTNQLNRFSLTGVSPGKHAVRLTHPEYLDTEQVITVEYGFLATKVNLPLRPARFTLTIQTEPQTTVRLDGIQVGETDPQTGVLAIPNVRVGPHQLSLQRTGYLPVASPVDMPESDHQLAFPLHLDLNGYWKGTWQEAATGKAGEFILSLGQTGTTLSGLWEEPGPAPTKPPRSFPVLGRLLDRQRLTLERKDETGRTLTFEGQVSATGREVLGTWQDGKRTGNWTGSRSDTKPTFSALPGVPPLPTAVEPGPRLTTPADGLTPLPPALPGPTPTEGGDTSPLSRAQSLYEQRRYDEALAQCDAILKQDPKNNAARDLKRRIQKSLDILKAPPGGSETPSP